ncbi:protein WVD2-like 7 isoform X2 [Punica granatum]|uniref:Protein WVD2-like 7 isoform X2 n=1 Tax=Punica granatum TaxID=22663 RepID=A0A6P8CXS2_PUNGR|nr:protein WVD2-like 7 isoform X2 [Punica granatum]
MGETQAAVTSSVGLEVGPSVSFGRFEADSLSWEKWSTFSSNKYLEEVEKCATPGSVAQKKAYFEAHYKKIIAARARKAELSSDQEKQIDLFKTPNSSERVIEDEDVSSEICENPDGTKEGKEVNRLEHCPELGKPEDIASVEEVQEKVPAGSPVLLVVEPKKDSENDTHISPKIHDESPKLNLRKKPQKANPLKYEEKNAGRLKKKSGSHLEKSPGSPTAKAAKPTGSKSSTKSDVAPSLIKSKNLIEREKKTVFPKSLHMSISLGGSQTSSTPPPSVTLTRKSFIMERMAEKDIVKRAFKSFQNSVGQSKSFVEERSPSQKPAPSMATELRASASVASRKDSGRTLKLKPGAAIQRAPHTVGAPSFSSRSNLKAEKRELQKRPGVQRKLGEKSDAKDAERTPLRTKLKEEKEAEIQKLRKNLNFKAAPLPSFYRGQSKLRSSVRQEGYKSEIRE